MITFSQFFKNWSETYYAQSVEIGKRGDFYTAVSVGNLFGVLLANHFLKLVDGKVISLPVDIVEIGANKGYLAFDFLQALYTLRPTILNKIQFHIIEPHENLRTNQKLLFSKYNLDIKIHKSFDTCCFNNAFFYANELFDCFACELIIEDTMAYVDENYKICFKKADKNILEQCNRYNITNSELCIEYHYFLQKLKNVCKNIVFNCFDYAKKEEKISARIYKNQQVYNVLEENLQDFFGKSDITYNVNFEHLIKVLKEEGFVILEFKNQNKALIDFGLEEILNLAKQRNENIYRNFISQSQNLIFNFGDKFKFLEFKL
ncbi:SAM-dependent methyltransferase [Campylobacter insulaenigrae]|uniref:SAM-dependent methyltransferase n=1 Tax=Campylobacter insulaenigrae NCTC 12927 TaxID=1031564 RepID=A0A0A8H3R7_9BACT|nr:SAM-dependent methyltransferase [Campylobacter insulaenigrae]AJC87509.1 SAM-dependent methyltransferase [Campylobacter insulaenigrae NCTC 12927]MCR6572473.1 SAM-dependent methyltransferase [Campylobacter insulaenigrae]MCR6573441.1 SAM-dependent methyltransferase [Campylobacter insulaenigrae]MCR6575356.1 SAM-dependent methyltransferase [Campylobacter insulaenigrae]MCR6579948.1 SAM-dependent methyltransferase [Campylobacter insulaenigrae]